MAQAENGKQNGEGVKMACFSVLKPSLAVEAPHAAEAILFYKRAFGAVEVSKSLHPKRKADQELPLILKAHLKFGAAEIIVCDETDEASPQVKSPATLKGTSSILHLETDDVDLALKNAVEAGATVAEEVSEGACGQRCGKVKDPFGFVWSFVTPLKEDSPVEAAEAQS